MIYLKEFATQADYDAFVASGQMQRPNVSYIEETTAIKYNKPIQYGLFIQHIDGTLYTEEEWINAGHANTDANGLAVVDSRASFVIAKTDSSEVKWGDSIEIEGLPIYSDKATALTDYNGKANTILISQALTTGAAIDCVNYTFPNGESGYLPAIGEWDIVVPQISKVNKLMAIIGNTIRENATGYWSSTVQSISNAWGYRTVYGINAEKSAKYGAKHVRAFLPLVL